MISDCLQKNEKKGLETLIQKIRIYSEHIGIEFGIDKYTIVIMKSEKREMTAGIKRPNQKRIKTLAEKENSKIFEISEVEKKDERRVPHKDEKTSSKPNYVAEISSKG